MRTKVISFDCYGTLIDWESGILDCFRTLLAAGPIEISDEQILAAYSEIEPRIQSGPYQSYRDVLRRVAREVAARFQITLGSGQEDLLADSLIQWKPFEDTIPALRSLKQHYRLAIVSNIDDDLFAHTARALEVPFDYVITAAQVRSYKPGHAHFHDLLRRTGLPREAHLHAAESLFHDIAPAKALGIPNVWVRRSHEKVAASKKQNVTPDRMVANLRELALMLEV